MISSSLLPRASSSRRSTFASPELPYEDPGPLRSQLFGVDKRCLLWSGTEQDGVAGTRGWRGAHKHQRPPAPAMAVKPAAARNVMGDLGTHQQSHSFLTQPPFNYHTGVEGTGDEEQAFGHLTDIVMAPVTADWPHLHGSGGCTWGRPPPSEVVRIWRSLGCAPDARRTDRGIIQRRALPLSNDSVTRAGFQDHLPGRVNLD
ncbi:hypothetical protein VTN02DRAFT_1050 [Thermoascus thermophilus]